MEELVLEELRDLLRFVSGNEKQFTRHVMDRSRQERSKELAAKKRAAKRHRRQIAELDTLIERLYVDNVSGKVPDERYEKMSAKFEAEQARGNRRQKVEIVYIKIGKIDLQGWMAGAATSA